MTIYFMKSIVDGSKKFLHQDRVHHLSVPQYEGLGIKQMLVEAQKYPVMEHYLPDERDWKKIPRQWLVNLIYTNVGQPMEAVAHYEGLDRHRIQ